MYFLSMDPQRLEPRFLLNRFRLIRVYFFDLEALDNRLVCYFF